MNIIFGVITEIEEGGGMYDSYAFPDKEGVLAVGQDSATRTSYEGMVEIKLPVFVLGEIVIMDGEFGREVIGRSRKPSKWFVTCEHFNKLEDAIARSHEVMRTAA